MNGSNVIPVEFGTWEHEVEISGGIGVVGVWRVERRGWRAFVEINAVSLTVEGLDAIAAAIAETRENLAHR